MQSLGITFLIVGGAYTLLPGVELSAPLLVSMFLLVVGLVVPLRAVSYGLIARRATARRVLILGTGPLARKIAEEIQAASHGLRRGGHAGRQRQPEETVARAGVPAALVRPLAEVDSVIDELCPGPAGGRPQRAAGAPARVGAALLLRERAARGGRHRVLRAAHAQAGHREPEPELPDLPPRAPEVGLAARRAAHAEPGGRGHGPLLVAPLMALVAILVKFDSPGPVFFIQERVGLRGRIFRLIKFRTMYGPPPEGHSVWLRDDCPRITRLGRWLRDLHLDELPQFVNVLRGDMDMVGPRPEMACNVQTMTEQIPYYGLRHTVRPGVTGWAQIKQGYSVSQAEVTEKMRYDLYYIKHLSLWLDLRILLATARIVLFGRKLA